MKARPSLIQKRAWHVPAVFRKRFPLCPKQSRYHAKKAFATHGFYAVVALAAKFHSKRYVHPWNPYAADALGVSARLRMPNKPLESASRGSLERLTAAHIPQPCCTKAPMGTCALSLGALRIDRAAARL